MNAMSVFSELVSVGGRGRVVVSRNIGHKHDCGQTQKAENTNPRTLIRCLSLEESPLLLLVATQKEHFNT